VPWPCCDRWTVVGKLLWQATVRYGGDAAEGKGLRDEIMEGGNVVSRNSAFNFVRNYS